VNAYLESVLVVNSQLTGIEKLLEHCFKNVIAR